MHGALFVGLETAAGAGGARHTQPWLCAQELWQLGWHLWPKEMWFSLHVAAEAELWFWVPQEPCGVLCRVQNLRVLLQALAAASLPLLGGTASVGPHKRGQGGALGEPLGAWQWCQGCWLCRNRVLSAPGWPGLALLSPGCPRGTGTPWPLVTFNGSTPLRLRAN